MKKTLVLLMAFGLAGAAWGQCVEFCVDGTEVTYRILDEEGEPFTKERLIENDYGNYFMFLSLGDDSDDYEYILGGLTGESDMVAEDGSVTIDLNTIYDVPEMVYEGTWPDDVNFDTVNIGAGLEGGSGPDPDNFQIMHFDDSQGDRTLGEAIDFGGWGTGCDFGPYCEGAGEPPVPIDPAEVAMPLGTGANQLNVPFFLDVDQAGSSWGFVGLHNNLDTPLEIGVIYFNSEGDQLRFDANVSPYNTAVIPAYASVAYRPVGDLPAALPNTIANRPQHADAIADGEGDTKNNGAIVIMWDEGGEGALQGRYLQVNGADSSAYLLPAGVAVAK